MENLPVEIVELILSYDDLCIKDIVSFSSTSNHFRELVCDNNQLWKSVYMRKWPQFKHIHEENKVDNWFSEIRYMYELKCQAHSVLADMSPRFYKRYELSNSDFVQWQGLMDQHPRAYHYLVDDLMSIVNDESCIYSIDVVPVDTPGNLTYRYYASKALRYIRQQHLSKEWETYMSLPPKEQVLERGAVLIAQWCQPNVEVSLAQISSRFDDIAEQVRNVVRATYPGNPLLTASPQLAAKWRSLNLDGNEWGAVACRQVMECTSTVLYKQLGFYGDSDMFYRPENFYINEVLDNRRGLPITLSIIYESVARRLGIKCEPISFPAHFLLRWSHGPSEDDSYYIDVYNQGQTIKRGSCPHARFGSGGQKSGMYPPVSACQVMLRMANNLEISGRQHLHPNGRITRLRSVLELLHLINPNDLTCILNLARLYMLYNMDVSDLRSFLAAQNEFDSGRRTQVDQIAQMLQDHEAHHRADAHSHAAYPQVEVAPRTPQLCFAVGMVMRHLRQNYTCVIYDWDPVCLASTDWQLQMNVHTLTLKDRQPFYNVLVEDGSHRYVAQENIEPTGAAGSLHQIEDVGRHFSHFYQTHFVPNAEKEKEYPEDSAVRRLAHTKLTSSGGGGGGGGGGGDACG